MNTEENFLQAMCDNPAEPHLPLVFADWLEEQGGPRAELLRLRTELTQAVAVASPFRRASPVNKSGPGKIQLPAVSSYRYKLVRQGQRLPLPPVSISLSAPGRTWPPMTWAAPIANGGFFGVFHRIQALLRRQGGDFGSTPQTAVPFPSRNLRMRGKDVNVSRSA